MEVATLQNTVVLTAEQLLRPLHAKETVHVFGILAVHEGGDGAISRLVREEIVAPRKVSGWLLFIIYCPAGVPVVSAVELASVTVIVIRTIHIINFQTFVIVKVVVSKRRIIIIAHIVVALPSSINHQPSRPLSPAETSLLLPCRSANKCAPKDEKLKQSVNYRVDTTLDTFLAAD